MFSDRLEKGPVFFTWKCGGSWSCDQNQHVTPRIVKLSTLGIPASSCVSFSLEIGHSLVTHYLKNVLFVNDGVRGRGTVVSETRIHYRASKNVECLSVVGNRIVRHYQLRRGTILGRDRARP